jgi:hypothetical protein
MFLYALSGVQCWRFTRLTTAVRQFGESAGSAGNSPITPIICFFTTYDAMVALYMVTFSPYRNSWRRFRGRNLCLSYPLMPYQLRLLSTRMHHVSRPKFQASPMPPSSVAPDLLLLVLQLQDYASATSSLPLMQSNVSLCPLSRRHCQRNPGHEPYRKRSVLQLA